VVANIVLCPPTKLARWWNALGHKSIKRFAQSSQHPPWNNDSAADWYADLFDETAVAAKVEEALNADPEEHANEIRAASAVLIMLGRTFIWPIDDIDRHLTLAIAKMEKVRSLHEDAPEFASAVAEEIAVLKSRQANKKDGSVVPQPSTWGSFWS
jgi:hypothetical protein